MPRGEIRWKIRRTPKKVAAPSNARGIASGTSFWSEMSDDAGHRDRESGEHEAVGDAVVLEVDR